VYKNILIKSKMLFVFIAITCINVFSIKEVNAIDSSITFNKTNNNLCFTAKAGGVCLSAAKAVCTEHSISASGASTTMTKTYNFPLSSKAESTFCFNGYYGSASGCVTVTEKYSQTCVLHIYTGNKRWNQEGSISVVPNIKVTTTKKTTTKAPQTTTKTVKSMCNALTKKEDCQANSKCSWADTIICAPPNCYHCSEKITQKPTQAATQKPTQAATHKPTQAATQKPTQKPTPTTYSISFNQNGGYGLSCDDSSWTVPTAGICKKSGITSGTTISVPKVSSSMTGPDGMLMGWTKTNCNQGNIITDSSVKVSSNVEYHACYRENIGGYRYLQEGFMVEGHPSPYKCGTSIYIEYCVKESTGNYCYYHDNGKFVKIHRNGLAENSEAGKAAALASCNKSTTSNDKKIDKYMYALTNSKDYVCGEALYITTCTDDICTYNKISKYSGGEVSANGTVNYKDITDNNDVSKKTCEKLNVDEDDKKCSNKVDSENIGTGSYTVCYDYNSSAEKIKDTIKNYYKCADGYKIDESAINSDGRESCNDKKTICSRTYEVTCIRNEGKYKPSIDVVGGSIGSDGRTGVITVKANSQEGRIVQYYASPVYSAPTATTIGWKDTNSDTFTISSTPGVMYIWVKDIKGNISPGMGGVVFDGVNSDTTLNKLEVYDSNNQLQTPTGGTAFKFDKITSSSYVRLSNDLVNDSVIAANGFNPFNMEYKLEVESPTVSVYATLTSSDSHYVSGYEPRTVNLDYGMNTVLIKIQNKEGKVRTYTILVNRVDNRKSDNTLSDLSVDVGKIEFNSNKTEYKIEIPESTDKVNVSATIGSDKASFVEGYKPGVVSIVDDEDMKKVDRAIRISLGLNKNKSNVQI